MESTNNNNAPQKQVILNAFDMATVGHLAPEQWKVGRDLKNAAITLLTIRPRIQKTVELLR